MNEIRTALVFPGQGSQHSEMLDAVPENDALERLLDAAEALTDLPLREILLLADAEELADTRVAQPLLYLVDWAWGVALLEAGAQPSAVAGHSLGELSALAIAGVFSVEAGLELVVERSKLMATTVATTPGGMSAVLGLGAKDVSSAIDQIDDVWVANDNAPKQIVITGAQAALDVAGEALLDIGARRIVPLKVAGPFHSPLMEPARSAFEDILEATHFRDATISVMQNTDPALETDAETIKRRLAAQISAPVRWTETMQNLAAEGPTVVVEAGPGTVLKGLCRGYDGLSGISAESTAMDELIQEVSQ